MLCREAGNKENVFAWDETERQAQIEKAEHVQCFQMFKLLSIPSLAKWFRSLFLQILQHPGDVGFFYEASVPTVAIKFPKYTNECDQIEQRSPTFATWGPAGGEGNRTA